MCAGPEESPQTWKRITRGCFRMAMHKSPRSSQAQISNKLLFRDVTCLIKCVRRASTKHSTPTESRAQQGSLQETPACHSHCPRRCHLHDNALRPICGRYGDPCHQIFMVGCHVAQRLRSGFVASACMAYLPGVHSDCRLRAQARKHTETQNTTTKRQMEHNRRER